MKEKRKENGKKKAGETKRKQRMSERKEGKEGNNENHLTTDKHDRQQEETQLQKQTKKKRAYVSTGARLFLTTWLSFISSLSLSLASN